MSDSSDSLSLKLAVQQVLEAEKEFVEGKILRDDLEDLVLGYLAKDRDQSSTESDFLSIEEVKDRLEI